jgi:hypothetical protein
MIGYMVTTTSALTSPTTYAIAAGALRSYLEIPEEVWTCDEHGIDFRNAQDYNVHIKRGLREGRNDLWEQEYWKRKRDPYWKNDSDYN